MKTKFLVCISFIIAYLIGSISSAIIAGRFIFHVDIKKVGSGNAGTTNAIRAFGKKAGIMVFIFDCLKGFIGTYLGYLIAGGLGSYAGALGAIIGHSFPVYFGFKGGKGIATAVGILLYLDTKMILLLLGIFAIIVILTKYVSLGSIVTVILAPIYTYIYHFDEKPIYFYTILALSSLILFNHRSNIIRLIKGKERKIGGNKWQK